MRTCMNTLSKHSVIFLFFYLFIYFLTFTPHSRILNKERKSDTVHAIGPITFQQIVIYCGIIGNDTWDRKAKILRTGDVLQCRYLGTQPSTVLQIGRKEPCWQHTWRNIGVSVHGSHSKDGRLIYSVVDKIFRIGNVCRISMVLFFIFAPSYGLVIETI